MDCIEMKRFEGNGYLPMIVFQSWRVALLNSCESCTEKNITRLQRHDETDEVFVLLKGSCTLILSEEKGTPEKMFGVALKPGVLYNVKKGVWHNHVLGEDSSVLVVEEDGTNTENSPFMPVPYKLEMASLPLKEDIEDMARS